MKVSNVISALNPGKIDHKQAKRFQSAALMTGAGALISSRASGRTKLMGLAGIGVAWWASNLLIKRLYN